jgi:hypothetical protein
VFATCDLRAGGVPVKSAQVSGRSGTQVNGSLSSPRISTQRTSSVASWYGSVEPLSGGSNASR